MKRMECVTHFMWNIQMVYETTKTGKTHRSYVPFTLYLKYKERAPIAKNRCYTYTARRRRRHPRWYGYMRQCSTALIPREWLCASETIATMSQCTWMRLCASLSLYMSVYVCVRELNGDANIDISRCMCLCILNINAISHSHSTVGSWKVAVTLSLCALFLLSERSLLLLFTFGIAYHIVL